MTGILYRSYSFSVFQQLAIKLLQYIAVMLLILSTVGLTAPAVFAQAAPVTIQLSAPSIVDPIAPVIEAGNSVQVGSQASISGVTVAMGSTGGGVNAGPVVSMNDLWSHRGVNLGPLLQLNGTLHAFVSTVDPTAVVGATDTSPFFFPPRTLSWTVAFPGTPGPSVHARSGQTISIAPGGYTSIAVDGGATVTLHSGTYFVTNLTVSTHATVKLDQANGPVIVYVSNGITLNATFASLTGGNPNLLIGYLGSNGITVGGSSGAVFNGAIVAPFTQLSLLAASAPHHGFFAARDIVVDTLAKVQYVAPAAVVAVTTQPPPVISPLPSTTPRILPPPPNQIGCYVRNLEVWDQVPCDPDSVADDAIFGIPAAETAINSVPFMSMGNPQHISFAFGQVETTFTAGVTENDSITSMGKTTTQANALSVQANTNFFTGNNKDQDWVQFVIQTDNNGGNTRICVWNFDITVFNMTGGGFAKQCFGGNSNNGFNIPKRAGAFQPFDYATVAGSTFVDNKGNNVLGLVAQLTWVPANTTGLYAVVAADQFGLAGNWFDLSGTVLGEGGGSQAQFMNTAVLTRELAGSCANVPSPSSNPFVPWPGICPTQPVLLPHTNILPSTTNQFGQNAVTGETNNLNVGAAASLIALNDDLVATEYLSSSSPGGACLPVATPHAFVRDTPEDTGNVPSNIGGQPFWESPDLFLVPKGAIVDPNAAQPDNETLVTPGQQYDVYVRINNDFGCSAVTGAQALVFLSDPTALSTSWVSITGGNYVGDAANPGGITVPAAGKALLGPLTFTAPSSGFGNGHKCLIAAIQANGEPAPVNNVDAPGSNQVAQRNVQFSNCAYPLVNATTKDGNLKLTLSVKGVTPTGNKIQVTFDDPTANWFALWKTGAGFTATNAGGKTIVTLTAQSVTLPSVPLTAGDTRTATLNISLVSGDPSTTVNLGATLTDSTGNTLVSNGGSCTQVGPPLPE